MKKLLFVLLLSVLGSCSMPASTYLGRLTYAKAKAVTKENGKEKEKQSLLSKQTSQEVVPSKSKEGMQAETQGSIFAGADNHVELTGVSNTNLPTFELLKEKETLIKAPNDSCDRIVFKNADEKYVLVTEISNLTIKYKACDNLDGPSYEVPKSEIIFIQYQNGKKEVFAVEPPTEPTPIVLPPEHSTVVPRKNTGSEKMILAGFVLSLIAYPLVVLFPPVALLGLVFSWSGLLRGRRDVQIARNEKFAIAGLILSGTLFAAGFIALILVVLF